MDTASPGGSLWASLVVPAAAAGTVAVLFFLWSLSTLVANPERWLEGLRSYYEGWLPICTVVGAAAGGAFFAPEFGLPGARGALRSAGAYVAAVFTGGFVGGTMGFPVYGSGIGPVVGGMVVQLAFEEKPYSLLLLLLHPGIGGVMHLAGRRRRRLLEMPPPPPVWPLAVWVAAAVLYNVVFFWFWPVH